MADDDKTRRPDATKGPTPEERARAGSENEDWENDEPQDDEDGSLTKMEMELQAADGIKEAEEADDPAGDGDQEPKPQPVEQPVPVKPVVVGADAPPRPNDAAPAKTPTEQGLKDDTITGALLLYALYRAARAVGSKDSSGADTLSAVGKKIKDKVTFYTGNTVKDVKLLPEENGMKVAVDGSGRPVWASMKTPDKGEKTLIFDWRADGGMTIHFEGPSGFEGRIASREKIEIAEGGKSLKSSDGAWMATSANGSIEKWEGELALKPGKSSLSWQPVFGERDNPLAPSAEQKIQNAASESLVTTALDGMTLSKDAALNFTFRERAQLRELYQGLMKGSLPSMEKALKDMCLSTKSEPRMAQMLNHFIDNAGLRGQLAVQQSDRGTRLVFDDAKGNLLAISGIADEASYAQRAEDGKKIPSHEAFLDLVRGERAARALMSERAQAESEGKLAEYQKGEWARKTITATAEKHYDLAPPQREVLKDLERRFVSGDMEGFNQLIQSYDKKPHEIEPILKAFVADMKRFSKDFDGSFTSVKNIAREYGYFVFGDAKNKIGISTEQGTPAYTVSDGDPGLRRSTLKIGGDLSTRLVQDTAAMKLEVVADVRQPMTGMTNSDGLWSPNYIDALPRDVLADLEKRINSEYALGGHEQMRDFAIRAGQTVGSWERTQQALLTRQADEERTQSAMEQSKQEFLKIRDEVLKSIGLDKLPAKMSLDQLQSSSTGLIAFLNSKEAKSADIADTRAKAKAVEDYQVARHNQNSAQEALKNAWQDLNVIGRDFLAETVQHTFPDGLTGQEIARDAKLLKEYLSHPDAATSGVKDVQQKLAVVEAYQKAQDNATKAMTERFEPARKRYEEIRDEVLTRLGADKIPSGMDSTGLRTSAQTVRDFLQTQGGALGIKDLERKIAAAEQVIATQSAYETARGRVNELFESRRQQFEKLANEMARDMGLPPVKLEIVTWDKNAHGDYLDGRVRINREHLLNSSETSVSGTVYHELIHAEQQYRMCRYLADEFVKQHGQQPDIFDIRDAWSSRVGGRMSEKYIESVLKARADKPLSADEAQVAAKLVDAWHKMGAVGTNYDKSMDAFNKLYRTGEDVGGFYGTSSTEKILDAYVKGNSVKDIADILPGAEFQTTEGKVKSETILRELVRDRVAYLNGETKNWDHNAARQKMFDAIVARRHAINEWREAEWASYGGPDKKHEYDAQVGGLFFERQAQEHKAKPAEFRVVEELLHGQKRNWLPENIKKHADNDSTTFRFSEPAEFASPNGNVKVKGVELKNGVVSVLCEDASGKVSGNKPMADLMLRAVNSRAGTSEGLKTINADPQLKAELLARYMQDMKTASIATYHQASQLGERKISIPYELRLPNLTWKDVEKYMHERLPEGVVNPEDLISREIKSLEALYNGTLNDAVSDYKAKLSERVGRESALLVRELAGGNIPLNVTVAEHLAQAQARFERRVQQFGKPANYEESKAIFEALKLSGKQRETAIKNGQARYPENKEIWQELLPKANTEALELQRQHVTQSLKERGFTDARIDPARKFNVNDLGSVLRIASEPGTTSATTPGEKYLPLPFTDIERTVLTTAGQDINLASAQRAESAISHARDQVQRGLIKSHHELEALVANDYLNSQLEAGKLSTVADLLRGGRRAINPHDGNFYGVANIVAQNDPTYRQRIEQVLQDKNSHTNKAVIEGKEVSFATLSRQPNQSGDTTLAYKGPQDIADKARVEKRKEALFSEIQALAKQEGDPARLKQITRRVAELEWLSVQSADYWQGSSELAQMRSRALFDAAGVETGRFKKGVNPGLEALTTPLSEFVANYEKMYENPPRLNPGDFRPSNEFARALMDTRTTGDTGTIAEDGSLFFKLKEPRKIKVEGVEHTIVGVEARDGKAGVVTTDQFGLTQAEPNLTRAYLSNMETSLRTKPIAQGLVVNDARLAANVLSRVIDDAPDGAVEETLERFDRNKSATRDAFLEKRYYTKGTGRVEWSAIASLKEALIDRQFETFRDVVSNLDSYYSSASAPGEKPSTDFDRVMIDFAKECKLAGLGDITHSISDKGVGEIRMKNGDLEIVMRTDSTMEATRKGVPISKSEAVDAFRELGEQTGENMRRRLSKVSPPGVGTVIEIPDKDWKMVKHMILAESGNSVFVKELNAAPAAQTVRVPSMHIAEDRLKSRDQYKMFTDPAQPEKQLFIDTKQNKVYELGKRHPLTWEHEAFERPDINARASHFARQTHLKSTLEKMQDTIESGRLIKQLDQSAQSGNATAPASSLVTADRARRFLERIAPDAGESLESVASRAREFYIHEAASTLENAVRRTKVIEDAALKAGESKLVFTESGKEFVPKTFDAGKETFETSDGRTLEMKNCRMEIRIGKGTEAQQAAREALVGFEQLKQELALTSGVDAEALRKEVRDSARLQFDEVTKEKTAAVEAFNREAVVKVGAFEVAGKNVDVFLTPQGVRIGSRELSNLELVDAALKDRRAQVNKAKEQEKQKLESEIKELEALHKDIAAGKTVEVEKMKVALVENIAKEYEARRTAGPTPGHGIRARAADAAGRAGAYLMIASFVASLLVDQHRQNKRIETGYAPTKAR
ncbi:MAG: hypothetical protein C0469_15320 [Cyanobacteria bacterium DS2.3.42]|nr:hypothetical protein [Cyanobacteria bacterium DS2.3.42]